MSGSSVLWQPYRSLGLVASASASPHLKLLGSERFLTVPLGKSWAVYNLDKLRVVLMGPARAHALRAITSHRDLTFTTAGNEIIVWRRQEEVYRLQAHERAVYMLYLFGGLLCSVDEGQTMHIWDVKALGPAISVRTQVARATATAAQPADFLRADGSSAGADWKATPLSTLQFPTSTRISALLHPSTYLNKLVVGFSGLGSSAGLAGGLELWNIKTRALVYRFKSNAAWEGADKKLAAALGRDPAVTAAKNEAAASAGSKRGIEADVSASSTVSVTCLEQSPAVDVVAVGLHNGLIVLLNLQLDQVLHVYVHAPPANAGAIAGASVSSAATAAAAPISALSFRTDNHGAFLASSCQGSGTVAIWDLEKKQLKSLIKSAHGGASSGGDGVALLGSAAAGASTAGAAVTIHSLFFLPNEPLLLTVGSDNALRLWIFDKLDGSARLLKERSGHALPPTRIKFYPSERGQLDILSASTDRSLRTFSLQKEEQSRELSQGSVSAQAANYGVSESSLKLTPITDFACCPAVREKEWSNILSAHSHDAAAYLWRWNNKSLTPGKLLNTNPGCRASAVKAVAMTPCGNFGLVGLADGRIDVFNVQSLSWKATFGANHAGNDAVAVETKKKSNAEKNINLKRKAAKEAAAAGGATATSSTSAAAATQGHTAAITGLAIDSLMRQLISTSLDGSVLFWDWKKRQVRGRLDLGAPVGRMAFSPENDLLAVMDDNLVLTVIDSLTHKIVRRFQQHRAPLTDMIFSPDGKWIVTSSTDCCVRVFDLSSALLVDFLRFSKPVSSLALSPRGEFLATTHVNNLGVYLWANKEWFGIDQYATTAAAGGAGESLAKRIARGVPIGMEVRERQDGEEETPTEAVMNNVKQEEDAEESGMEDEEPEDDEEAEEGAGRAKRRRANDGSSLLLAGSPALLFPESDQFDLITYSSAPRSLWHTLAHLEEIKTRNRPTAAVTKPAAQPFFLTALASLNNQKDGPSQAEAKKLADTFGVTQANAAAAAASSSSSASAAAPSLGARTIKSGGLGLGSHLVSLLETAKSDLARLAHAAAGSDQHPRTIMLQAYAPVSAYLQSLTPSAIDGELHALGLDPSSECAEFRLLLEYFLACLETRRSFELTQACLNRFLKIHGSAIVQYKDLLKLCATLQEVQAKVWTKLETAFQTNLALVSHVAQIQM